ncbi:hypothetical protein GH714_016252 [Hevea brasiliensis]|uniref:R13L1/DRL21-like LRR repeat region domain-containing protein n=1 Tax=Hevea brasiliensis TaxID=3981 RepID=A0A6A6N2C3_HEVBR|nr:hypothetical protein GH714_016252 [Hevea brasiliensis]
MPHGIGQLTSIEDLSLFMVDKDNGVSKHGGALSELSNLNNLRHILRIMNLRYVKNPASEFKAANLKEKQHLQALTLSWKLGDPYDNNSDNGPDVVNDEEMSLEELRPHLNLKWSCPNLTSMPLIPSVQRLVLINASKKSLEDILKMKISCRNLPLIRFPLLN